MEDLVESLPRCDKIIQRLLDDDKILVINAADKKKVVFLRENAEKLQVNHSIQLT
jgi:hypothetical protein